MTARVAGCVIAANRRARGRCTKSALVEGALALALVAATWRGLDTLAGRVALFAAAVQMGVLLAILTGLRDREPKPL